MTDPSLLVEQLNRGLESYHRGKWGNSWGKGSNVWASMYSPCTRALALNILHGDEKALPSPDSCARMNRGKEVEVLQGNDLAAAGIMHGWTIEGAQQRFELKARDGKTVVLSGKIDGFLVFGSGKDAVRAPIEWKNYHPNLTQRIKTVDDLERSPWTRGAKYQMLAYLLGNGLSLGFLALARPGLPLFIPLKLEDHLEDAERWWQSAEVATLSAKALTEKAEGAQLPPFIEDASVCATCPWFRKLCLPPEINAAPSIILSEEILEAEKVYWETRAAHKAFEAAEELLKDAAKGITQETSIVGGSVLQRKTVTSTKYSVPAEVKKPFAEKFTYEKVTISRPQSEEE